MNIKRTDKQDGSESIISLENAVAKLNDVWTDPEQKLLAGGLLQTPYAFYQILTDEPPAMES